MPSDTSLEIELKMSEMIQSKSPIERFKMGSSMYETSKILVSRAIREKTPGISEADFRIEFFLRFYGNDFDLDQKNKIITFLKSKG